MSVPSRQSSNYLKLTQCHTLEKQTRTEMAETLLPGDNKSHLISLHSIFDIMFGTRVTDLQSDTGIKQKPYRRRPGFIRHFSPISACCIYFHPPCRTNFSMKVNSRKVKPLFFGSTVSKYKWLFGVDVCFYFVQLCFPPTLGTCACQAVMVWAGERGKNMGGRDH